MNKVLLPCPFCGSKAEIIKRYSADYHTDVFYARCVICNSMNDDYFSEAEAIEAWNRRVETDTNDGGKVLSGDDYCSHCGARLEWK